MPADIDPAALAAAIEAKLRASGNTRSGRSGGSFKLLERRPDGRSCHRLFLSDLVAEMLIAASRFPKG